MRKAILLAAAAAFIAVPAVVEAQTPSDNATIQATATIPSVLTFDRASDDFDFGTITAGEPRTVEPSDGLTFEIDYNVPFRIDFAGPENLTFGNNNLPVTWHCLLGEASESNSKVECDDLPDLPAPDALVKGLKLALGGELTDTAVPGGTYTGVITITLHDES